MKGNVKTNKRKKAKKVPHESSLKLTVLVSRQRVKGSNPVNLTRVRMTEKVVLKIHELSSISLLLVFPVGWTLISIFGLIDICVCVSENLSMFFFLYLAKMKMLTELQLTV